MDERTQEAISIQLLKRVIESRPKYCPIDANELNKIDENVYAFNVFEKLHIAKREEVFEKEKIEEKARVEKQKKAKKVELSKKLNELKKNYKDVFDDVCEMNE